MRLELLGWTPRHEADFAPFRQAGLVPGRVITQHRSAVVVATALQDHAALLSSALRRPGATQPAVGDWVALRTNSHGVAAVEHVLPRSTAFSRKAAGETTREQVVAANVDAVFIVCGLDGDFNLRRIERYLALAWESGALPVIVLTKRDLSDDPDAAVAAVSLAAPGVRIQTTNALANDGVDELRTWLGPGRTAAFLGSSGAGKSTLVNALLGEEVQVTGAVRADDSRGRHTTTARQLFVTPAGCYLDTPGMREVQVWDAAEGIDRVFPEIVALLGRCRFRDCGHAGEPGCAVQAALDAGELDSGRWESWRKLQAEEAWFERRHDQALAAEHKKRWKAIGKLQRQFYQRGGGD